MGRPAKTLHIKTAGLWPSVLYAGSTVVKFMLTKSGKRIKVIQRDGRLPRHKRLPRDNPPS